MRSWSSVIVRSVSGCDGGCLPERYAAVVFALEPAVEHRHQRLHGALVSEFP